MNEKEPVNEARSKVIAVRLTQAEHAALADAAHAARRPLAVFVRAALAGVPPPAAPRGIKPGGQLDQILTQLRGLGVNLNQISKVLNSPNGLAQVAAKAPSLLPFMSQIEHQIQKLAIEIKSRGEA